MTDATTSAPVPLVWKTTPTLWVLIALSLLAAVGAFLPALRFMVATWEQVPEFGYGYFIPFVSAYLIWQRSDRLRLRDSEGSWTGLWLVLAGLLLGLVGALSAIRMTSQYGFVLTVFGIAVTWLGWQGSRIIAAPLAMLVFMIPLPQFLLRELSEQLQLLSSQLGVALIVLSFALNRLPATTRASARLTALPGPGQEASFESHLSNWIGPSGDLPIAPEG